MMVLAWLKTTRCMEAVTKALQALKIKHTRQWQRSTKGGNKNSVRKQKKEAMKISNEQTLLRMGDRRLHEKPAWSRIFFQLENAEVNAERKKETAFAYVSPGCILGRSRDEQVRPGW